MSTTDSDAAQSSRPIYTEAQLDEYFSYIELPTHLRPSSSTTTTTLPFLNRLIAHQLTHIPFENLDLHYSPHHSITLDTTHLFHKIVTRRNGRGGYCMENNLFFGTVLRSLGVDVMPVGARVSSAVDLSPGEASGGGVETAAFSGWSHTVNVVTLGGGERYFCDVGFGARGPTGLVKLVDGVEGWSMGAGKWEGGNTRFRLRREWIRDNTHRGEGQLLWVYSVRFDEDEATVWMPAYCFTEVEYLPQDFKVMSFYVSKSPTSWFTQAVVCHKFLLGRKEGAADDEEVEIVGDVSLSQRTVKQRRYGKSEKLAECGSEKGRLEALQKYFGMIFTQPEANGIQGMVTMIK